MFGEARRSILQGVFDSTLLTRAISHLNSKPNILSSLLGWPSLDFVSLQPLQKEYLLREQLQSQSLWFVQLRWLAVFIALTLVLVTGNVLDILPEEVRPPLLFCILLLAMCNLAFWYLSRNSSRPYQLILIQTILDLFFLTLFLHFSGGLENPLFILYTLHTIIAGILMTPRACYLITTVAVALLSFMAIGECTGILAHHTIDKLDHTVYSTLSVGVHLLSFTGILFLTAYFTTLIMGQLRKSQFQLCRAGKLAALGEIVGQIAHEVNNPIAIISAKAKLLTNRLQEGCTMEKALLDLQKIDTHAERIASITKGLLAFCRPSAEKKAIIDVNQAVKATLRLLDRSALNGLSFRINLAEKPLWIYGNFNELQQVFLNIINNAIDAMPDGGQLEVTTLTQDNSAIISLTDSGVGIPPGDIDLIFDPFFTTKPEGKGTGLGLSISHGIVQDHGGHIDVASTLGRGSTFTIRLPLRVKEFGQ
ncbi:MAG: sensor histidine kinase [Candidatus Brocadiales bacterium]